MRLHRSPKICPVEREGLFVRMSDGSEVIDCQAIVQDTGLPVAIIKSEIEHKYMHGRHFYNPGGSMVERGCYESWKSERLPEIKAKLEHMSKSQA